MIARKRSGGLGIVEKGKRENQLKDMRLSIWSTLWPSGTRSHWGSSEDTHGTWQNCPLKKWKGKNVATDSLPRGRVVQCVVSTLALLDYICITIAEWSLGSIPQGGPRKALEQTVKKKGLWLRWTTVSLYLCRSGCLSNNWNKKSGQKYMSRDIGCIW